MYKKSFVAVLVGFMMLSGPFLVSADTVSVGSLQTKIQTLLARVKDLQAQIASLVSSSGVATNTPASMPSVTCYSFGRSLSIGVKGTDVSALQQLLVAQGFSIPAGVTGYFGVQTKSALANWQAKNNVIITTNPGSGIFGPLSRGAFNRWCSNGNNGNHGNGNNGNNSGSSTSTSTAPATISFTADPQSGVAPLNVTFTASAPLTSGSSTLSVDFGDTSTNTLMAPGSCIAVTAIVGGQSGIRCSASTSHLYTATGTYTARLMQDTCPAGAQCLVGPLTVATTTITVNARTATTSSSSASVRLNAPGSVTIAQGGIAEIRNKNIYFTLTNLTATSTTIQVVPVGCWNSFPSDIPPQIVCMIFAVPIPPQTLTVGQAYRSGNTSITLTKIKNDTATFFVTIIPTL